MGVTKLRGPEQLRSTAVVWEFLAGDMSSKVLGDKSMGESSMVEVMGCLLQLDGEVLFRSLSEGLLKVMVGLAGVVDKGTELVGRLTGLGWNE